MSSLRSCSASTLLQVLSRCRYLFGVFLCSSLLVPINNCFYFIFVFCLIAIIFFNVHFSSSNPHCFHKTRYNLRLIRFYGFYLQRIQRTSLNQIFSPNWKQILKIFLTTCYFVEFFFGAFRPGIQWALIVARHTT